MPPSIVVPFVTPRNYPRAALLASLVFAVWPLGDAFLKMAGHRDVPKGEILLICGLSSMAAVFIVTALRGKLPNLRPQNWKGLLSLGACQLASFSLWVSALPLLPLANAYVFSFLAPMAVACLAAAFLKEPFGWNRAGAIAVGFSGVVVAVHPESLLQNASATFPYLLLFVNMLASATQMFLLRVVADKEQSESTVFYARAVMAFGGLILCFSTGFVSLDLWTFLALCGSGAIGGLGWTLLAQAFKYAPAAAVAPFQYSQLFWGAIIGFLIWEDLPTLYLVCGVAIIIAANLYLFQFERRISRTMPRI